jgi:ATP-binding cassette subfamily F protein 3
VLSGGEKARVALAKTILSKANFLLLDEPTNHLDIHSTELLIDALNRYGGSYILVSHDRYFISKTANKIWEIVDHEIKEFKGGYEEYVAWKERMESNRNKEAKNTQTKTSEKPVVTKQAAKPGLDQSAKSGLRKELQKQQKQFEQIEKKLATLNETKAELENKLAHPETWSKNDEFKKTETAYQQVMEQLTVANSQYETAFEKLMKLEDELGA